MATIILNTISRNHGNKAMLYEIQLGLAVLLRKPHSRETDKDDKRLRAREEAIYASLTDVVMFSLNSLEILAAHNL